MDFFLVVLGLALLTIGGEGLIRGSLSVARRVGVSPLLSGLVIVGFGTSAPELVVSLDAALSGRPDIAVGNVVGSNIFNLLGILGVSAHLQPLPVHVRILSLDQWVMLGAALLLLGFLYTERRLSRLEGFILVACYGMYVSVGIAAFG